MTTKEMTKAAMFTAFACVAAIIARYGGEVLVPFSLMPLVVFLAGGLLGGRVAAVSMVVYVLLGLLGIPVFASAPFGGVGYVLKPTFGFLLAYIATAWVIGTILKPGHRHSLAKYIGAMVLGLVVLYAIGLPYLYLMVNYYLGKTMSVATVIKVGALPFIGFDLIKLGIASVISWKVNTRLEMARKEGTI
ncbi:MAG TPA: biotin transporter BioY [Bacillota bacterium]|nr:biotin transporter BioY [Bacillota bacterium]